MTSRCASKALPCVTWQSTSASAGLRPRGEQLPPPKQPEPAGDVTVQVVRTVPAGTYKALPKGDYSILESYLGALRSAEHLVYLENQFLWSPEVVDILADKLRIHRPTTSGSSSCSRRERTTARTSRAARSRR